jgi:Tol biopolymer transport system component
VTVLAALSLGAAGAAAPLEVKAVPANGNSGNAAISADGRLVAIASEASDLVGGDTNGVFDVFVRDRRGGSTERVSVGAAGAQANGRTGLSAISPDGRFVLMWSEASNLVPGDMNDTADTVVRDRVARTTERVSVSSDGAQANGESARGSITPDGRFVAFASVASNLVSGDTDGLFDVFVRDRSTGLTEHVGAGTAPAISADGRFIAFESRFSGAGPAGIVVRDRATATTELVSVGADGAPANGPSNTPTISADGRFVAFASEASNLVPGDTNGPGRRGVDVFVRDRVGGTTERVSVTNDGAQADGASGNPTISSDGKVVAFTSSASNLGAGSGARVAVRDLEARTTELVSVTTDGRPADGDSYTGSGPLSADGRFVAFFSLASNLAPPDTTHADDVFVRDRVARTTELVSTARARRLTAERLALSPKGPRAGRSLTATMRVSVDGRPVSNALVSCAAGTGAMRLQASAKSFRASSARCVWRIPRSAKRRQLRGAVSVTTTYGRATRTFASLVR